MIVAPVWLPSLPRFIPFYPAVRFFTWRPNGKRSGDGQPWDARRKALLRGAVEVFASI
jgi:hypothetical protein